MPSTLATAIAYAQAHEVPWPRDPRRQPCAGQTPWGVHHDDPPPFNRLRGPVHAPRRAAVGRRPSARRGDRGLGRARARRPHLQRRQDLPGAARRRRAGHGLLPDEDERVSTRLPGIGFDDSEHNRAVTWAHLLTQTSEWEGTCFGLPDTVDRWRKVAQDPHPPEGRRAARGRCARRARYWEYNDVRINQLALALLHLFRRPLPEVFLEHVLAPLGGGAGFAWRGYDDAWVDLPGVGRVQSVPGGSHWGAGVSISARDQARIGQLVLDGGVAGGRQLIASDWIARDGRAVRDRAVLRPAALAEPRRQGLPRRCRRGPRSWSGAGGHYVGMDPELDAVIVLRWLDPAYASLAIPRIAAALAAG